MKDPDFDDGLGSLFLLILGLLLMVPFCAFALVKFWILSYQHFFGP